MTASLHLKTVRELSLGGYVGFSMAPEINLPLIYFDRSLRMVHIQLTLRAPAEREETEKQVAG